MKAILAALVAASLAVSFGGEIAAAKAKKGSKPPTKSKLYRQSKPKPFDEHGYYERLLKAIRFGTAAWWRQQQEEGGRIE